MPESEDLEDVLDLSSASPDGDRAEMLMDRILLDINSHLNRQMNAIIHHPVYRTFEKAWRELHYLACQVSMDSNVVLHFLPMCQESFASNLLTSDNVSKTELFKICYSGALRKVDEFPYSLVVLGWEFGRSAENMEALTRLSHIAATCHTLIGISLSPGFFGAVGYPGLAKDASLADRITGSEYVKWRNLRCEDEARYLVLSGNRFALRLAGGQDNPSSDMDFQEETWRGGAPATVWGSAAIALAAVIIQGFTSAGEILCAVGGRYGKLPETIVTQPETEKSGNCLLEVELPCDKVIGLALHGVNFLSTISEGTSGFSSIQTLLKPRSMDSQSMTIQLVAYAKASWALLACRLAQGTHIAQKAQKWNTLGDLQEILSTWIIEMLSTDKCDRLFAKVTVELDAPEDASGWILAHYEVFPSVGWEGIESPLHVDVWLPAND